LPPQYRPILSEQLRTMGGTRFFVNVNKAKISLKPVQDNNLVDSVVKAVRGTLSLSNHEQGGLMVTITFDLYHPR
jgi:hypothetical protein